MVALSFQVKHHLEPLFQPVSAAKSISDVTKHRSLLYIIQQEIPCCNISAGPVLSHSSVATPVQHLKRQLIAVLTPFLLLSTASFPGHSQDAATAFVGSQVSSAGIKQLNLLSPF